MAKGNRQSAEVNSGSMADIAFLLLIFFLVTTTIPNDKGITLQLPPYTEEPPPILEENEKNIFKVLVNAKDMMLVEDEPIFDAKEIRGKAKEFILNFGKPDADAMDVYNSLPPSLKSLSLKNPKSSDFPKEAIVSFKTDRGTSYERYITVLDELKAAYYEIYGARIGMTADEFRNMDRKKNKAKYARARTGIPMNISIAEPGKAGGTGK